ncbi:MAG: C25 family cysteine peptidase, partial [Flavobacteriales bacterium]
MKKILPVLFLLASIQTFAQTTWGDSLTVQVTAVVQPSPAQITLNWPGDPDATAYQVYRKLKGGISWGVVLASLPANATNYTDLAISVNTAYEYKVTMTSAGTPTKYGYAASSIELAPPANRGIAIVVVENTYIGNAPFATAVNQYLEDLEYDGWYVKTIYVNQTDAVSAVKTQIVAKYNEDATNTKLVSLIGHVPVPYSGDLNPDGHPDHEGAWPTDTYYADMDGNWTDVTINVTVSSNPKNHNIPADGKYDQSYLPSNVDVQIGRFDFYDMPAFGASEEELLIRYLNKAHLYKTGQLQVIDKALIDDNFTTYTEGFSQSGYRNFAPLVGTANITNNDYFTQLSYN